MKVKVMLDSVGYKQKPTSDDVVQIQKRFKNTNALKELEIEDLFNYIKKGYSFIPAVMSNGTKNDDWVQGQLVCIDIDNKNEIITPNEAINKLEENNIHVTGYYHTFSSTDEIPKFRILLMLSIPVTNRKQMEIVLQVLIDLLHGDQSCKNVARLFFGTDGQKKEVTIVNAYASVTIDDVIKLYKSPSTNNYNKDSDLTQLAHNFDLASYIHQEYQAERVSGNTEYYSDCPICGHKNCFRLYLDTNTFYCFGANGNVGGTIIDYLMHTKSMTNTEAVNYFMYELLKLPKPKKQISSLEKACSKIKENIKSLGFEVPKEIDWLYENDNGELNLSCPRLARYIGNNIPYVCAKSNAKSGQVNYFYQDNKYVSLDENQICGFISKFIEPIDLHSSKALREVFKLLSFKLDHIKSIDDMNADENIINFINGIYDIRAGKLFPHSHTYLSSIQIPCVYMENCPKPKNGYFDKYLNDLTKGDEAIKKLILQGAGIVISNIPGYRMKQAFFFNGPGNSGKSIWKLLLIKIIGVENCTSTDLKDLEKPFHTIELLNKRLAGSNDMSGMKISSLEKFKQLTGGDYVSDSYKNEGYIDFRFNGVIWMLGNRMPVFGGDKGDHVYDRMIIIDCDNVIPEEQRDKRLLEHLLEEKDYIISLFIKGLKEVIDNGYAYDIPESCKQRNKIYRVENDSFLSFMEDCVVDRPKNEPIKDKCTVKVFYDTYREWCKVNNGNFHQTKKEVKKMLNDMGKGEVIHTNGGYDYFKDVTISPRAKIEFKEVNKDYAAEDFEFDKEVIKNEFEF